MDSKAETSPDAKSPDGEKEKVKCFKVLLLLFFSMLTWLMILGRDC